MSFANLLDNSVNIFREVGTDDGSGGQTHADTYLYRRIPCRFEATMGREQSAIYGKSTVYPDYYCYCSYISGIKEGDRLIDKYARQFEIKMVMDWSMQNKYLKLAVVEIARGEA